jgi:hypothetical protein
MRKLALALIFLLISSPAFAEFGRSTSFDDREICDRDKGVWREFGNSAADNCESKMDKFAIAAQALTYACDCGKGRCWNGDRCVLMSDFKKQYDEAQEKQSKKIAEARKNRQDEYHDNSNKRLRELMTKSTGGGQNGSGGSTTANNLAQFADKILKDDQTRGNSLTDNIVNQDVMNNNVMNSIGQNAQTIADKSSEAVKQVEQGPLGQIFTLPKSDDKTTAQATTPASAVPQVVPPGKQDLSDPALGAPTPFFLEQQAKAKAEADAAAALAKSGITVFDPTKPATSSSSSNSSSSDQIPGLPQIPLPQ